MTPEFAFLAAVLISLQLQLHFADAFGSASTVSVAYGTATVCGITAGKQGQRIQCYRGQQVISVLPHVSFEAISGGQRFFCGLRTGGFSLHCWETDAGFQPKRVYHSTAFPLTDLAVGDAHVCAREVISGRARCWRGTERDGSLFPSPDAALQFHTVTSGSGFSCGILKKNRTILCWGSNGIGSKIQSQFGNLSMVSLVAGESHVCGLTASSGVLICKGNNNAGQLEVPIKSAHEYIDLALGASFTCAIRQKNGAVSCWGGGAEELNIQNNINFNDSFELITAGSDMLCGLKTSNLIIMCWSKANKNSPVVLPLGMIIPGPCVQDPCSSCGIYPNSAFLCDGSGNICKSCQRELPIAVPLPKKPESQSIPGSSSPTRARNRLTLAFLIVGAVGVLAGACTILFCISNCLALCSSSNTADNLELKTIPQALMENYSGRSFSLMELAAATSNFSSENKIGGGSFGVVYKGELSDGTEVAIKRGENNEKTEDPQEKQDAFTSELATLLRLNHKHLVGMVGYCQENDERILVYEFMPNGSLHDHLHNRDHTNEDGLLLNTWKMRIKIALDAARGIEYLHNYAVPPIIHRDIKSSNILLDGNFTARVSDFGFSLMPQPDISTETTVGGTIGYIDPEYYVSRISTSKSDVYGLGIVLLELLTGKKAVFRDSGSRSPVTLVEFAVARIGGGELWDVVDKTVRTPEMKEVEAVEIVAYTAMHCVSLEGEERPNITDIVGNLEKAFALCNGDLCENL
ncbi:putative serine/threonine-protein kinase-like protein CCR3 [Cucurbita pepo subsp. pepo]|uniref:putative serine/threonine-protein kinase-like protein CCR3 n=1 Tax=Cucurbita pepo subsp. pepo TaxID=3664 RepID=UPI000C9D4224|nr:putative serine/threonine-protein kinase-like protein CCR3 [Cucurbita pepo subsp. pepo]